MIYIEKGIWPYHIHVNTKLFEPWPSVFFFEYTRDVDACKRNHEGRVHQNEISSIWIIHQWPALHQKILTSTVS